MDPLVAVTSGTGVMFLMNVVSCIKSVNPNNHPQEDGSKDGDDGPYGKKTKEAYAKRLAEEGPDRWTRVAQNNHENFGLALGVLWAAFTTDTTSELQTKVMYCFLTYVGARLLFIICYVFSLQPFRSIAFMVGQASVLVAAGFALAHTGGVLGLPLIVMGCTTIFYLMNLVARLKSADPKNHPPEDKLFGEKFDKEKQGYQKMEETGFNRWHRIAENQGENLPISVLVLMSTVYVRNDAISGYCLLCYFAFRVLFLVCYLLALQPFRSLFFIFGNLSVITSAVLSILSAKSKDDTIQLTATVCSLVLFIIYNFALLKAMNPNDHPAEDSKLGVNDEKKAEFAKRLEGGLDRWTRVAENLKESLALALYVLWAGVFAGVGINAAYCFGVYLAMRIAWMICYLFAIFPWRSLAWVLSTVSVLTAAGLAISTAINNAAE